MLAAARAARAAGRALPALPVISPPEAFRRAVAGSPAVTALRADASHRPVLRDLDVQDLVGHLSGVERDVHRALAGDPAVADADHVARLRRRPWGRRATPDDPGQWRTAADPSLAPVRAADLDPVVPVHGMRLPLGACSSSAPSSCGPTRTTCGAPAAGRQRARPARAAADDRSRREAAAAGVAGRRKPRSLDLHLVLTGPGGGTWDVPVGRAGPGRGRSRR